MYVDEPPRIPQGIGRTTNRDTYFNTHGPACSDFKLTSTGQY